MSTSAEVRTETHDVSHQVFNPSANRTPKPASHSFDQATHTDHASNLPEPLNSIQAQLSPTTIFYEAKISSAYGTTENMPNGGYVGSIVLSACLQYQSRQAAEKSLAHVDPLTITFDYMRPCRPGNAWIAVDSVSRGSLANTTVTASLYQIAKSKSIDGHASTPRAIHAVSAMAMFGDQSKQEGVTVPSTHYGDVDRVEELPVPHPRSWYIPPDMAMISQNLDLLVKLETQRRPQADYFVRFHPTSAVAQQFDPSGDAAEKAIKASNVVTCKGSKTLPLRSPDSRRVDTLCLPTFADFRRPAMENVFKKDADSAYDEPVRAYAYPTLQLTLRFLRKVPQDTEWVNTSWRETALNGRVISDLRIATEDGTPLVIGQMDSLMFDMRWFKM